MRGVFGNMEESMWDSRWAGRDTEAMMRLMRKPIPSLSVRLPTRRAGKTKKLQVYAQRNGALPIYDANLFVLTR
jgi:hypothetical protein